jgi:hypothetical protein
MSNINDDLIVDLTDLLDEEDSANKQAPEKPTNEEKALKLETESFDLGRELSNDSQPEKKPKEEFDFDKIFRESLEGITAAKKPEPLPEQPPVKEEEPFIFEDKLNEALAEKPVENKVEHEFNYEPVQPPEPVIEKVDIEAAKESLTREIPEMVESIARPVISELINEIVSSVKKDLPGIIEKVIREEIEKLKKID